MTKGELKDIIRECYEELLAEDNSDILLHHRKEFERQQYRSQNGESKRPAINDNMSKKDKQMLHDYDHGGRHKDDHQYDSHNTTFETKSKGLKDAVRTMDFGDSKSTRNHCNTQYGPITKKEYHTKQTKEDKINCDSSNYDGARWDVTHRIYH